MAKWAEIKCERCAEQDALWEGMERALDESDAREARLEAKLAKAMTGLNSIASNTCCDKCQEAALVARTTLAELTGGKDE